jgi:phenylpropionate dioxygenase-like ring-hydroxylating dioxygenase large terminal subunit
MIKNQWYAVLSSHQLRKGQVLGARRFGENLVFYRTMTGQIGCANSLCPHRKASLAKGRMEKDHIKCPFHGIEYDVTGKCVYIWLFLGAESACPMKRKSPVRRQEIMHVLSPKGGEAARRL